MRSALPELDECRWRVVQRSGAEGSPSRSYKTPNLASQMRTAFASMA